MNTLASLGTLQGLTGTSMGLNLNALTSSVTGKNVIFELLDKFLEVHKVAKHFWPQFWFASATLDDQHFVIFTMKLYMGT